MKDKTKKILIVAGEASGDHHGSALVSALLKKDPNLDIFGVGGDEMKASGVHLLAHSKDLAVTGIFEVLLNLVPILKVFSKLVTFVKIEKPDAVILIDYPDFNLRLAKKLQNFHVPILYYISPQVWAWRQQRVKQIQKWITKMLVVFPFEEDFYRSKDMDVTFVGHPLLDRLEPSQFSRNLSQRKIVLLPGSRKNEIKYLLPQMVLAARKIKKKYPEFDFILPVAPTLSQGDVERFTKDKADFIQLKRCPIAEVIKDADVVISCSGTATLETAILGKPMVIVYKLNWFSYLIGRVIIKSLTAFGMPNILYGKKLVPELLQGQVTGENIARKVFCYLEDVVLWKETSEKLLQIRKSLGTQGASQRAASEVMTVLNQEFVKPIMVSRLPLWLNILRVIFSPLLWVASLMYEGVVRMRNGLYDRGRLAIHKVPAKVISVGNIQVGGTGKTPFTMALSRELQSLGKKTAILSRGYKRKSKNAWDCVTNGTEQKISIKQAGDEPSLMANKLSDVPIYVGSNRYKVALEVLKRHAVDVFLLDDGFQHRQLHRDLDIVTFDSTLFYKGERLLPLGHFREPVESLKRAHCFILTRIDQVSKAQRKVIYEILAKVNPSAPIVEACYRPKELRHLISQTILPLSNLEGKRVFAFAGIGNPQSFKHVIHRLKGQVVDFKTYLDHFSYKVDDVSRIIHRSKKKDAQMILTTEKDAIRFPTDGLGDEPLYALSVDLEFTRGEEGLRHLLNGIK